MSKELKVVELLKAPELKNHITAIGKSIDIRLELLDVENIIATEENRKSLKATLADIRKEQSAFEEQRTTVKKAILKPYTEFEGLYSEHIKSKYNDVISKLSDKISIVELAILKEKEQDVRSYFDELCNSEEIDFVRFEQLNLVFQLSTTVKKYKDQCNLFIDKVKDDLNLIDTQEFKSEIIVEFKKTLNGSNAITTVLERKKAEKKEAEDQKRKVLEFRHKALKSLGFFVDEELSTYVYSDSIYISCDRIKEKSAVDFEKTLTDLSLAVEEDKESQKTSQTVIKKPDAEILKAPEKEEAQIHACIKFQGTLSEMKAIKNFLVTNNYKYTNINIKESNLIEK